MTESDPAATEQDAFAADIQDLRACLVELREAFDERDYAPILGAILATIGKLEALPALRDAPEEYERRRTRALDEARRVFNAEIAQARSAILADAEEIRSIIGQLRDKKVSMRRGPQGWFDLVCRRSATRKGGLFDLGGFADVAVDLVADDTICHLVQVLGESSVQLLELGPKNLVDERAGNPEHYGRDPLSVEPVRLQSIAAA